ncbi:MAG: YCF48-related protein [Agriterribacter sp.]
MKKIIIVCFLFALASCKKDNTGTSKLFETLSANTTETLTDISFINKDEGIISGSYGYLAKTSDGGKTWNKLTVGVNHSFMSAYMLTPQLFYTARVGIYKTTNAGQNFSECSDLSKYSNSIFGIHFFNKDIGLVVKGNVILKTTDGGDNWVIKYDEAEYLSEMHVTSAQTGYAAGGITYDGASHGEMHKTTDGGETWKRILTTNSQITAMYFINDNTGFYADFAKNLYKTTDGGTSWSKVAGLLYSPLSICFTSEHNGYFATYEGKILQTADGGNTWNTVYEKTTEPIVRIIAVQQTIYAAGNNGLLLKRN